jgi:hypothetical protein
LPRLLPALLLIPCLAALTLLGGGVSPWSGLVQSGPLQLVQTRLWGG